MNHHLEPLPRHSLSQSSMDVNASSAGPGLEFPVGTLGYGQSKQEHGTWGGSFVSGWVAGVVSGAPTGSSWSMVALSQYFLYSV